MKTNTVRPIVLAAAGLLTFAQVAAQITNQTTPPLFGRSPASQQPSQFLRQSLGLTDEQVNQLEPVLKQQQAEMNALRTNTGLSRQERAAKMNELRQASGSNILRYLTPEQAQKWNAMRSPPQFRQPGPATRTNAALYPKGPQRWHTPPTNQPPALPQRPHRAQPGSAALPPGAVGNLQPSTWNLQPRPIPTNAPVAKPPPAGPTNALPVAPAVGPP